MKEKLVYENPRMEIRDLENADIVTLSEGELGDPNKIDFGELEI